MDILLIQILRLGDALQMTPIIRGLKQFFQEANISVLTSSVGAPIFSSMPEVSGVYSLNKGELTSLSKSSKVEDILAAIDLLDSELSPVLNRKWDWVINFSYSFPSAILAYLADGASVSGFYGTKNRQFHVKEKWLAYCISAFVNRKFSILNWVNVNKNILNLPEIPNQVIYPLKEDSVREAEGFLQDLGIAGKKIIGLVPGASDDTKRWPVEKFSELAGNLTKNDDYKVIVFGDENEKELGRQIFDHAGPGCKDLTGKTSLDQLSALISKCSLLVTNDTGPMHLAAAVGTPVIGLFFTTHFVETGPYGANNIAVFPDISCFPCQNTSACSEKECLNYIQPNTVLEIVTRYDEILDHGLSIKPLESDGPIGINKSIFDPWGNLDWKPIDNRLLKSDEIIRFIYKGFWLSTLMFKVDGEASLTEYLIDMIEGYGQHPQKWEMDDMLRELRDVTTKARNLFNENYRISLEMYDHLKAGNHEKVNELGELLQKKEDDASLFEENPYFGPVFEYTKIRMDNLVETNLLSLALKTANYYHEFENLALRLLSTSESIADFVNSKVEPAPNFEEPHSMVNDSEKAFAAP